ncbi:MAG: peptidase M23 [Achromobacter kerstersii]|uniref:peptidoglycan DD-metalloendopeptidase family protein n=1 Tax=Achromobacter kerstersii TaxID=1353890 RepID=UPI003D02C0C5
MLISAPFLRAVLQAEDAESNAFWSLGEKTGKGAFPVSHQLGWHGGVHLVAPGSPQNPEPVRAIADGVVVYARQSNPPPQNSPSTAPANDPLMYYKGWTSNGVLVLKHDTEIGEGVSVTFYSIYQHLHALGNKPGTNLPLKTGDAVYRKEAIAKAGYIYGERDRIHFEIVADQANVDRLLGRSTGTLKTNEGRRNCVWGDIHFVLPANTPLYEVNPREHRNTYLTRLFNTAQPTDADSPEFIALLFDTTPKRLWEMNRKSLSGANRLGGEKNWFDRVIGVYQKVHNKPEPTAMERTIYVPGVYGALTGIVPAGSNPEHWATWHVPVAATTQSELVISISEQRGAFTVTARNMHGKVVGILQGTAAKSESSYELYKTAVNTYPGCPSAGFEMLRFGRVLGPDAPAQSDLYNGRLPHIRRIRLSDGSIFHVDLNAAGVRVYSDADFPHWQGWTFIDDDLDGNSRCDSGTLLNLIEPLKPTAHPAPQLGDFGDLIHKVAEGVHAMMQYQDRLARATAKIRTAQVSKMLRRCVVKIPTEWSRDDFDQRWRWLKVDDPDQRPANVLRTSECLSDEAYGRLKRHHLALAFWEEAQGEGLKLDKVHYHFHPLQFIEEFRKCGWWSPNELKRIYPLASRDNIGNYLPALNFVRNKYYLTEAIVAANFMGQAAVESNQFIWMRELYNGDPYTYFRSYAKAHNHADWLGNVEWNDGGTFRGRGFKQLTGRGNYKEYWVYRGWLDASTVGSEWWKDLGWWGITPPYVRSQHSEILPIQDAAAVAILIAKKCPPIITDPERIENDSYSSIDTAGWFWIIGNLRPDALENDVIALTRKIRGDRATTAQAFPAAAHFPARVSHSERIYKILGSEEL